MQDQWYHKIFETNPAGFGQAAMDIFRYQATHNEVYGAYLRALGIDYDKVQSIAAVPFLPVRFFKSHVVQSGNFRAKAIFESSGTSGTVNSRHAVKDPALYEESFTRCFELFYGPVKDYCIIGLLPSYLERKNSSLIWMVDKLVRLSEHPQSGFYLNEYAQLAAVLSELDKRKQKTLLIGVSFALLDFAEQYPQPLQHTIVMETGGMKGRRKEMIRAELQEVLKKAFAIPAIHSEYGMTELLSQAYSQGEGIFRCPPWMKILVRDEEDPFVVKQGGSGTINVIDLANIHSCSFIATDDAGKLNADGSFEVLGRVDGSDLRGCSLMVV
ncbi:MAG: LuxE/PaaK family acyltransferase [Bacteroidota bacterium]